MALAIIAGLAKSDQRQAQALRLARHARKQAFGHCHETIGEPEEAARARIDLAKALLRLEAMPRLEADLKALRDELKTERQERIAATQQAAVLEAKLEAARERAVQAEAVGADMRAAAIAGAATKRETARIDGAERRRPSPPKN